MGFTWLWMCRVTLMLAYSQGQLSTLIQQQLKIPQRRQTRIDWSLAIVSENVRTTITFLFDSVWFSTLDRFNFSWANPIH